MGAHRSKKKENGGPRHKPRTPTRPRPALQPQDLGLAPFGARVLGAGRVRVRVGVRGWGLGAWGRGLGAWGLGSVLLRQLEPDLTPADLRQQIRLLPRRPHLELA